MEPSGITPISRWLRVELKSRVFHGSFDFMICRLVHVIALSVHSRDYSSVLLSVIFCIDAKLEHVCQS